MLEITEIMQRLSRVADRVQLIDPPSASRLRDLGDAVGGGADADMWAQTDIYKTLNPDRIVERFRAASGGDHQLRWLEFFRNTLVLAPLALTWIGIALAVNGYQALLDVKPELAQQSFIYLWQSGFEGRSPLSLGTLAITDGLLLLTVLILTFIVYGRSALFETQQEKEVQKFQSELDQALGEADLALAARRQPHPVAAMSKLQRTTEGMLQALQKEHERLEGLAERRERELGDLSTFTAELGHGAREMVAAAEGVRNAQEGMNTGINALSGSLSALTVSISQLNNQHTTVMQALAGQQESIVQHMTRLEREILPANRDAVLQLGALVGEHKALIGQLSMLTSQQKTWGDSLVSGAALLGDAVKRSTETSKYIGDIGRELGIKQGDLLATMEKERESQTELAKMVAKSNADVEGALHDTRDIGLKLHAIAVEMTGFSEGLPGLTTALSAEFGEVIKAHQQAAYAMQQATNALQMVAQSLNGGGTVPRTPRFNPEANPPPR